MKKLCFTAVLAVFAAACMFKPLPEVPTLGEVKLPIVAEEETVWTSTDYKGKPVLMVFMGSWCPWCKKSMPAVMAAEEKYGDQVEIVAVFMDNDAEAVAKAAKEHGFTVTALYQGGKVAQSLDVNGLPHAILFDKKHRAIKHWEGFSPSLGDEFQTQLADVTK